VNACGLGAGCVPAGPPDGTLTGVQAVDEADFTGAEGPNGGTAGATDGGGGGGTDTTGAGGASGGAIGGGGGTATGGCGASCNRGFPHWMQNLTLSGTEVPQEGQVRPATAPGGGAVTARGLPQDVQNFSPGLFWFPQIAQAGMILSLRYKSICCFIPCCGSAIPDSPATGWSCNQAILAAEVTVVSGEAEVSRCRKIREHWPTCFTPALALRERSPLASLLSAWASTR
jgi:hypothetical protein